MKRLWILTATGKDQPGIVAGVTKILYRLGCNLEDSSMTRLASEFTIMVIFSARGGVRQRVLEEAFGAFCRQRKLVVHLKALTREEAQAPPQGPIHRISVYGADRPGIVYRVSDLLARLGVNITDVSTHRTHPELVRPRPAPKATRRPRGSKRAPAGKPLYLMLLEVELPGRLAAGVLERRLRQLAARLGVDVSLRSAETQVL